MENNIAQDANATNEKTEFPVALVALLGTIVVSMIILGLKLFEVF